MRISAWISDVCSSDLVFGEDLLLSPESAAHARGVHAYAVGLEAQDAGELVASEVRHLRRRADHDPPVVVQPPQRAVGLQLRVRDAARLPCAAAGPGARGAHGPPLPALPAVPRHPDVAGCPVQPRNTLVRGTSGCIRVYFGRPRLT